MKSINLPKKEPLQLLIISPLYFYRFTLKTTGYCQIVQRFCQNVYTFWQNNPRTEVHPLPNVKTAIKTQENNVTFRPM